MNDLKWTAQYSLGQVIEYQRQINYYEFCCVFVNNRKTNVNYQQEQRISVHPSKLCLRVAQIMKRVDDNN